MAIPPNFLLNDASQSKQISVAVVINGVDSIFTNHPVIGTTPRYGDPGLTYGMDGLTYGRLVTSEVTGSAPGTIRDYLILEKSSIAINQKIEPEQGKGSTTLMSLTFIDKDGYMTRLCSPGIVLDEMLGREVNVYLGYQNTSWPEDYFRIFRGYVSDITAIAGTITLQLSDPGFKKQQNIFVSETALLETTINNSTGTVHVVSNANFYAPVLNLLADYDVAPTFFLKIDDEYIQYYPGSVGSNVYTGCTRGAVFMEVDSAAAAHTAGATVSNLIVLEDAAIDMALKIMLSGWNGNWIEDVDCDAFNTMPDPLIGTVVGAILLPLGIDAIKDYGLSAGDQVTIAGGPNDGLTGIITGFANIFGQYNRCIVTDGVFSAEVPATGTLAFRSQFDTYPIACGMKMSPQDVDVAQHLYIRNNFLTQSYNSYRFWFADSTDGKAFLETEVYFPVGAYACTRQGRASMVYTKPPFGSTQVVSLDKTNILKPETIRPFRSTNKRRFFNDIIFSYDYDSTGVFDTVSGFLDTTSLNQIGKLSQLPINSQGLRTDKDAGTLIARIGPQLLNLYKTCATQLELMVNFGVAVQIEIGDPVYLNDNGDLLIANFQTGERDLGSQVFTVIERLIDIRQGYGKLVLMSGSAFFPTDRFASVAPSSILGVGTTATELYITDSYGPLYPRQEYLKWLNYVGLRIWVHNADYSVSDTGGTFLGFNPSNSYILNVSGLSITPAADYILELAPYSSSDVMSNQAPAKKAHVFLNPSLTIVTGIDGLSFTVSSGDAAQVQVGLPVIVHSDDYVTASSEVIVDSVVGTTITVRTDLGFTPSTGQIVDLVGFPDGGQPYRWI